ncbi:Uncharacterized protein GBIM_20793 [Gryllus bimaculatus]|nr:Uncharacterized protein GBIM_20793 [Gryllus bimaculatus]
MMARRTTGLGAAGLLLLALFAVEAVDAMARASSRVDKVRENYNRVLTLWKKGPQPRAIEVKNELQGVGPMEVVHPRQTVLHRCDELACCGTKPNPQDHRCQPHVETVTLCFHATVVGTQRKRFIEHQFQNHTACECVSRSEEGR